MTPDQRETGTAATDRPDPTRATTHPAYYPSAEADRIFCPDCQRAVFYQRLHVSTHEADCPPNRVVPDDT